jgi:precorrin-2 C(20)-methyltransferase
MKQTASEATRSASGHLFGVGVGPGDPDLMTVAARRVIERAPIVAHFAARRRPGNAWTVVQSFVSEGLRVLRLEYPVTTEAVGCDDYERTIEAFYDQCAQRIAVELDAGNDVAVICEGDPFFYGSYMYVHERLAPHYPTTVVPGVTSFSAAAAAAGVPLVSRNEVLTILPGVLAPDALKDALAAIEAGVVLKVGRHLDDIRDAARSTGNEERAIYVERASCDGEIVLPLTDTADVDAPYFSLVLLPGRGIQRRRR